MQFGRCRNEWHGKFANSIIASRLKIISDVDDDQAVRVTTVSFTEDLIFFINIF